jgi:molybdate transport system substrate-binding protein
VVVRPVLEGLASTFTSSDITNLANSPLAVIIKKGASKPAMATTEEFKTALRQAKSVVSTNPSLGGASAGWFDRFLQQIGLKDELQPKLKYVQNPGINVGKAVEQQDGAIGISQRAELTEVHGIDYITALPPEFNIKLLVAAGVPTNVKDRAAAEAYVKFLTSPTARAAIAAAALEPM